MNTPKIIAIKISHVLNSALVAVLLVALSACSSGEDCEPSETDCEQSGSVGGGQPDGASANGGGGDTGAAEVDSPYTLRDINHIIVVTGQSNVEAAGTAFDANLDRPNPRVFAFTDQGWRVADLHQVWDINAHPGNHSLTDPNQTPNNNFVFHFGKSLANVDPQAVPAFIVLAAPGVGIANWDYESEFYWKIRTKINNALSQLPHRNKIDVMLWHQGESDAQYEGTSDPNATGFTDESSPEYINYYQIKLRNVINNFRSESWANSDLPFICGETRISFSVNRRLMELNSDNDPNTACVKTTDLPYLLSDPSGAHYSAEGLRELGRRYMQRYLSIIRQ